MLVVATAGHVDHGKSTLVSALTGMRTDRLRTERERGLTQDLGFTWFHGPPDVALVDVPGHERYLATTLAGLGPGPAALLVVAADAGWREQTQEHARALAGLGATGARVVLAVTRADVRGVDDDRVRTVLGDASDRLTAMIGAPHAAVVTAAPDGRGLAELRSALLTLPAAEDGAARERPARLWVDRTFTVRGTGTVITGTLTDGTLGLDPSRRSTLRALGGRGSRPLVRRVSVRGLQSLGDDVAVVGAPARVAVAVRGLAPEDVQRGDLLTDDPEAGPRRRWVVRPVGVGPDGSDRMGPDDTGDPDPPREVQVHLGSASLAGRLVRTGDGGHRLHLRGPVAARPGDRAVLRSVGTGRLVGALEVLAPLDPVAHRPRPPRAPSLGVAERRTLGRVLERLGANPWDAPPAEDVRALPGGQDLLSRAERAGLLRRLGPELLVGATAVEDAVRHLAGLPQPFTVAQARVLLRSSRRVVVPLLERTAAEGLTAREGPLHRVSRQDLGQPPS